LWIQPPTICSSCARSPHSKAFTAARLAAAEAAGYRLLREEGLRFSATLTGAETIQDLVAMTPHAHRVAQAGRIALADLSTLVVTVDVAFRLLKLDRG
jgi:23S rRNA (guanine745-N1)-methyltransferase